MTLTEEHTFTAASLGAIEATTLLLVDLPDDEVSLTVDRLAARVARLLQCSRHIAARRRATALTPTRYLTDVAVSKLRLGDILAAHDWDGQVVALGVDGIGHGGCDTYRVEVEWPEGCPYAPVMEGVDGTLRKTVTLPRPPYVDHIEEAARYAWETTS